MGRAKDPIKSGSEWINLAESEAIIGCVPGIALAAVVGRAHDKWVERSVQIVEAWRGAEISANMLLQVLRGRIADWWHPDAITRVVAMRLALTEKIDRKLLRAEFGSTKITERLRK